MLRRRPIPPVNTHTPVTLAAELARLARAWHDARWVGRMWWFWRRRRLSRELADLVWFNIPTIYRSLHKEGEQ